jgi:hypothetical protein
MLVVAVSLSEQVEKVGAYAGIAAFFGFAILAILCFAQARELKRLRDWAGRAPERAAELEARVMADAASRARQPLPVTPAAQTPPVAAPAPAAAAAPVTPAGGNGTSTEAPVPDGGEAGAPDPAAEGEKADAAAADETAPGDAAKEHPVPAPAAQAATATPAPATGPGNGTGSGEVPPLPRATPAPRPGAAAPPPRPRPGAAPLRAGAAASRSRPGAPPVPPAGRPGAAAPARGPEPAEGRSPGRLAALVAGGVVGLVVLVFAATQIFGGDETRQEPNLPVTEATAEPTQDATREPSSSSPARAETTVAVLNGTTINGLAKETSETVAEAGFEAGATADYTDQARSVSIVFYADGARRPALEVARLLKIPAGEVREMDESARVLAGDAAEVVVVVGADQAP